MRMRIAGLDVELHDVEDVLAELQAIYREFDARTDAYSRVPSNPHLCFAGCSHCCREGAFFAVTLVEALRWALAVANLPEPLATRVRAETDRLLAMQRQMFTRIAPGPFLQPAADAQESLARLADRPGDRDEESFSKRVATVATTGVACPLLEDDRCSVYANRPFLCRAYGFPVDAYAVESATSFTFRSLCRLYKTITLQDYVVARDLRQRLDQLSVRLAGGANLGRFTSAEAILAEVLGA